MQPSGRRRAGPSGGEGGGAPDSNPQQQQMYSSEEHHRFFAAAGPSGHAALAADDAVRNTPEYRAAWDVELWRAVQLQRLEKELKEYKKRLQEEIRHAALAKEKDAALQLDLKTRELAARERKVVEDERVLERRKLKLLEAEREIRQQAQAVADERRRVAEESEVRLQRIREDFAHKLELQKQSVDHGQQAVHRAEERLRAAQEDFRKLYEEHNAFRLHTATNPDAHHVQFIETLRSQHAAEVAALSDRTDRRMAEAVAALQHRLQASEDDTRRLSNALTQRKEQLRAAELRAATGAAKVDSLQREVSVLLRQQLSPIPPYPSSTRGGGAGAAGPGGAAGQAGLNTSLGAHDIHDLSALRDAVSRSTSLELSKMHKQRQQQQQQTSAAASSSSPPRDVAVASEIERLQQERDALLHGTGGAYTTADPIVRDISARIQTLQRALSR